MSSGPDRLDELAARLARIESFLERQGFTATPASTATPSVGIADAPSSLSPSEETPAATSIAALAAAIDARRVEEREAVDERAYRYDEAAAIPTPDASPVTAYDVTPPPPPLPPRLPAKPNPLRPTSIASPQAAPASTSTATAAGGIEQAIGLKVAGWIGAVVLVIGGALGIKFAYDQGWLGNLPPQGKLALLYAVALGLVGLGEYIYRRVAPLAAVGVFGAGIALLFVVSYAGQAYFDVFATRTAFALMAASCAVGFAIALRGRLVSIAVLSLIGANIAPLILHETTPKPVALLTYVLALQLLAVGLAFVGREGRWWTLRVLSLVTTSFWIIGQLAHDETTHAPATILFAMIYAAIFQVENAISAFRRSDDRRHWSPATFSMAVTAALSGAVLLWTSHWPDGQRSAALFAMAGIAVALGVGGLMIRPKQLEAQQLASSAFIQAGTLLFIALPVAIAGPWLVLSWASLALGYAALGWWVRRPLTLLGGVVVWSFACAYLFLRVIDTLYPSALRDVLITLNGVDVPIWFVLALVLQLVGHAIALIAASPRLTALDGMLARGMSPAAQTVACVATAGGALAAMAAFPPTVATGVMVATAWALLAFGRVARRPIYALLSLGLIAFTCAKWLTLDLLVQRLSADFMTRHILLNAVMGAGFASVASFIAIARLTEQSLPAMDTDRGRQRVVVAFLAIVWIALALCVEVDRAAWTVVTRDATSWRAPQLAAIGHTIVVLAAALMFDPIARRLGASTSDGRWIRFGIGLFTLVLTAKFVLWDSLAFALLDRRVAAMPVANVQTIAGLVVVGALSLVAFWNRGSPVGSTLRGAVAIVPLVIGSIELDRLFGPDRTLVALSVYWSLFAIAAIVAGFAFRWTSLRFGGLALLAITLFKIVLLDLANAGTGWRILSFLGVGVILLATSVLYGKLSPVVLGGTRAANDPPAP